MAPYVTIALLAITGKACVLHGTDSGVCDFKLEPSYVDPARGWTEEDTRAYRFYHMPYCGRYVRYPACVPATEPVNRTSPDGKLTRRMEYEAGSSQPNDRAAYEWLIGDESTRAEAEIYGQAVGAPEITEESKGRVVGDDVIYAYEGRIPPDMEHPEGRFYGHTTRNKDFWVKRATEHIIKDRLGEEATIRCRVREGNYARDLNLGSQKMARGADCGKMYETADPCEHNLSPCINKYGEGSCEGVDTERCEGKDPYNPNGGPTCGRGGRNSGCRGWPIEPRMSLVVAKGHGEADTDERCRGEAGERSKSYNKKGEVNEEQGHMEKGSIQCPGGNTCQKAFRAYFCYLNFPRCYWDDRTDEMKSVPLCRSACKNFFKACNYDKSLWRCGRSEWMNGNEPEDFAAYGRYMRDFFPGQPFRNSYKSRGYRNIHGRCTPGVPDDELGYRGPFEERKDEDKEDVEEQRRLGEANATALDRRRGRFYAWLEMAGVL